MKYSDFDSSDSKPRLDPSVTAALIGAGAMVVAAIIGDIPDGPREDCSSLRTEILEQAQLNPEIVDVDYEEQTPEQDQCDINRFLDSIRE